ncbi:MAG TPA: hypothetical protein PKA51_13025 [Kiritimatiellia bacterium]|nr:hypothetical protein [Kiritimatiellia bacterium]
MKKITYPMLLGAFCAFLVTIAQAQVPALINYQGRLVDGSSLVNGTVQLELSLYDAAVGGALLYTDANPSVTVIDGLYDTYLGDDTTFGALGTALASPQVWLEVVVNGTPLSPRERLVSVPYAMRAGSVGAGSIGFNQLSQPYQAGRIDFQDLGLGGLSFVQAEPQWHTVDLAYNQPFVQVPSLSMNTQMSDPILLSGTQVQTLNVGLSNATLRVALPRAHQSTGMGMTVPAATIVDGRPAKITMASTQVLFQIAADAAGLEWNAPVTVLVTTNTISYASLAIINGQPAVAAAVFNNTAVYYARAHDAAGTTWGAPLLIANLPAQFVDLAEINTRPAVVFETRTYDFMTEISSNAVWYVVATDTTGTAWNTPLQLDNKWTASFIGLSSYLPRLILADSLPAVVYMRGFPEFDSYTLRFQRANNIHGTSAWASPVSIYTMINATLDWWYTISFDAAEVAGHPAVIVTERDPSPRVRYIRSSNAQGSAWPAGVVAANENIGQGLLLSLAIVDGRPAVVAIGEGSPKRLLYVRAANATGSSWIFGGLPNLANPQIPLPLSSVKLLEVDGEPAIFYNDRYLRSTQVPQGALHWMAVQP